MGRLEWLLQEKEYIEAEARQLFRQPAVDAEAADTEALVR